MPAALPPMTSRQAKRLGKKTTGQFHYTASQLRRADRKQELEERRTKEQEKERKRKENKRKREEQQEQDRATKRRLIREGKLAIEDTLGKVTSSQPRLSNFFNAPMEVKQKQPATVPQDSPTHIETGEDCNSQEETLVERNAVLLHPDELHEGLEYISDQDLFQMVSTLPHPSTPTPPVSFTKPDRRKSPSTHPPSQKASPTHRMPTRRHTSSTDADTHDVDQDQADEFGYFSDFEVAEDETAQPPLSAHLNNLDAPNSSRSVLSEMSVANVNTRAQDKPDTTSAPGIGSCLLSPSAQSKFSSTSANEALPVLLETDREDANALSWDKENTDPLDTPSKDKPKTIARKATPNAGGESSKKPATPGFSNFDDCEDIFDFDFDTGIDDFDEDGVDDATLMAVSATHKITSDIVVNANGSPKMLSPTTNQIIKPVPLQYTPKKNMPAPPPNLALNRQPSKLSESFSSLADEDFLVIAEQVEQQLSQKKLGKQKDNLSEVVIKKSIRRTLPWERNPLPPPNTQDYLEELVEEVDAEEREEAERDAVEK